MAPNDTRRARARVCVCVCAHTRASEERACERRKRDYEAAPAINRAAPTYARVGVGVGVGVRLIMPATCVYLPHNTRWSKAGKSQRVTTQRVCTVVKALDVATPAQRLVIGTVPWATPSSPLLCTSAEETHDNLATFCAWRCVARPPPLRPMCATAGRHRLGFRNSQHIGHLLCLAVCCLPSPFSPPPISQFLLFSGCAPGDALINKMLDTNTNTKARLQLLKHQRIQQLVGGLSPVGTCMRG